MSRELRTEAVGQKKIHHELAGDGVIVVADADRTEQPMVTGVHGDELADSLPQEHERNMASLILGSHEGASELDAALELVQELAPVLE